MTFTSSGVLSGASNTISGYLSGKYNVSGASMTTKVFTSGKLTHETVLENTGVKGLKLTVLGGIGPDKSDLVATGEYVHPHLSAVVAANCLGKPSAHPTLTIGMRGVTAGVKADFDVESKEVSNVEGALNYTTSKEYEATVVVSNQASKANFTYSHIVKPDFSVAAEFTYDKEKDSKVLTMASKYDVDAETTVKSKIDSAGAISLSYIQEVRKNTTLTLCTKFDVRNTDKPSQQFGLALAIE